ncbi:LuxR C-terminal-related transcriptional regulator [Streptomyces sp. NPDC047928]|uniref:helix-turn-helix transcriptional regulator n=1 Tax=unclassified Streptomyces TaxID=2593676 RepID=UPI0037237230
MAEQADVAELRTALLRLRRATGLPVTFGGLLGDPRRLRIGELNGTSSEALRGLAVSSGSGLGGRSIALTRPCAVTDYRAARHISHEYDEAVAAEGLRAVVAVPVVVRRRVRAVLYGALRHPQRLGDRILDAAVAAARDMEQALVVRDAEPRPRWGCPPGAGATGRGPAGWQPGPGGPGPGVAGPGGLGPGVAGPGGGSAAWEHVRAAHGELRALAPRIADPALRAELLAACGRLATAADPPAGAGPPPVALAPRELDVLAAVAAGATNAAAARRLGLRPETVKGYLRSAMRKLGAHTRLEAVVAARRAGLLP